jgi:hypothetical protein
MRTLPVHPVTGARALGWRKARPGEDDAELYPLWPILGAAEDDADEDQDDDADDADDSEEDDQDEDAGTGGDDQDDDTGEDGKGSGSDAGDGAPLGPKGEKALARMKEKLRAERAKRREAEGKLTAGSGDEAEQERQKVQQAATAKANARILRSEVRAAAKGKLADPKDALTFLDLSAFEVDEDGDVDVDEIEDAIDELIKTKPYLAAQSTKRFQGTADGGAARKAGRPRQLTDKDLDRMSPEEIVKAQDDGRLDDLLGTA